MLVGRRAECERLDRLLGEVRLGRSASLVIVGAAGVGKTALLDHLLQQAEGFEVRHVVGIETEMELPYAGLHLVLQPFLHVLDAVPEVQARALRIAFALEQGTADPFAASVATLSLLGEASEHRPVLVAVDDVQWIDRASREALLFAARRLKGEPVAIVCTLREGSTSGLERHDLEELALAGLDEPDALTLLAERWGGRIVPAVRRGLVAATGGNPLALAEVAQLLSDDQREGREPLPEPLPVSDATEQTIRRRLAQLPERTREGLLMVAADEFAARLIDPAVLFPAEASGIVVRSHDRYVFQHPLFRAAVYSTASAAQRRDVHNRLAQLFIQPEDADRRAWHLAAGAAGPDERVASLLVETAQRAEDRGGVMARARALERAADLSPDREEHAHRLHAAARAAQLAGDTPHALELIGRARADATDPLLRADVVSLEWMLAANSGAAPDPRPLELEAEQIAATDPQRAARLLDLIAAAADLGCEYPRALELTERSIEFCRAKGLDPPDATWVRLARVLTLLGQPAEASKAAARCSRPAATVFERIMLEQYAEARSAISDELPRMRERGNARRVMLQSLALAELEVWVGNLSAARAAAHEALFLAEAIGEAWAVDQATAHLARVAAIQGREEELRRYVDRGEELSQRFGNLGALAELESALGLFELGTGQPEAAVAHLRPEAELAEKVGIREPSAYFYRPDLIEAHARAGDREAALEQLALFEEQAQAVGRRWALAAAARLRGFLGPDEELDGHFGTALSLHKTGAGSGLERARTQLLYGERLRRARRRVDAREQLRAAIDGFDEIGATPWATRARMELQATGERIPRRDPAAPDHLTPQELQIAGLVAQGKTNRDVAAALFVSPKTVEFHLTHVYRKLDLHSRSELIRLFATTPPSGADPSIEASAVSTLPTKSASAL